MGLKDLIIWSIIGLQGLGLIFDGQSRNNFFTAISYVHNYSDKQTQDLAEILRIVLGLLLASAFLGIAKGIVFKIIPTFSFILYFVFANNSVLLASFDVYKIRSMVLQLVIFLFAIESLINSIENTISPQPSRQNKNQKLQKQKDVVKKQKQKGQKVQFTKKYQTRASKKANQQKQKIQKKKN